MYTMCCYGDGTNLQSDLQVSEYKMIFIIMRYMYTYKMRNSDLI